MHDDVLKVTVRYGTGWLLFCLSRSFYHLHDWWAWQMNCERGSVGATFRDVCPPCRGIRSRSTPLLSVPPEIDKRGWPGLDWGPPWCLPMTLRASPL
jgi:hypothetical protein